MTDTTPQNTVGVQDTKSLSQALLRVQNGS